MYIYIIQTITVVCISVVGPHVKYDINFTIIRFIERTATTVTFETRTNISKTYKRRIDERRRTVLCTYFRRHTDIKCERFFPCRGTHANRKSKPVGVVVGSIKRSRKSMTHRSNASINVKREYPNVVLILKSSRPRHSRHFRLS